MNEWLYKWNCVCCVVWKVLRTPTRYTLGSMVSHFQKLFDVTSLSGVYPRMNEVYTRLGEMTNTMRNLRDVLELGNPRLESKLHCVLYLSSRSDRTQELKMLSWCWCSCVRQQGSSCWGREQGGQTGFLHWTHCWIPSAAGRGWHWQVRTQQRHIIWMTFIQRYRNPKMSFHSLQHHRQSEAAWRVLPCFPCPHHGHFTHSRYMTQ